MKRMQFSIVSLLGMVTLAGLGCAALVNASGIGASITVNVLLFALLAAVVGAVYLQSPWRAFCGGFAIFGGAYFLLTTMTVFNVEPWSLTGAANELLYSILDQPSSQPQPVVYPSSPMTTPWTPVQPAPAPTAIAPIAPMTAVYYVSPGPYNAPPGHSLPYMEFNRIAHSLWAVLLGVAGGVLARCAAGRRHKPERSGRSGAVTPTPDAAEPRSSKCVAHGRAETEVA